MSLLLTKQMLTIPGWRIEQRYSPGVLIGNWSEERHRYAKQRYHHNSTHRTDFRNYGSSKPDVIIRRAGELRNEGLSRKHLLNHHDGNKYSSNMVSSYDEHFNGRWKENPKLTRMRTWNGQRLQWAPEKSDFPLLHEPTNFGLWTEKQKKWEMPMEQTQLGDYNTTYEVSYTELPFQVLAKERCANPKAQSSTLHKYNHTNENLNLRNVTALKLPEKVENKLVEVSC
ncbi:uncharacterized protein C1orf158 homolog [Gigantopelta aegis]|uniref:uncharacterized protein C1orf158 homolog n=1 Tax=Gigantopelta aegis TaxID=1735272 RepID=UPI001B88C3B5|nr:uncharacterized protein C1orf158 homolog [Gigantopelta aegis]